MSRFIVFCDTETTSLAPSRRPWEIALLVRDRSQVMEDVDWVCQVWDVDLSDADPASLKFGKFYERHTRYSGTGEYWLREKDAATNVEALTRNATIVGANPSFDTECLAAMLRRHGLIPAWHYRTFDVESLVAGRLGRQVGGLAACAAALDIPFPESEQHTAEGDARMCMAIWDRIMGGPDD